MQELEAAAPDRVGVERAAERRGVALARAEDDGAAPMKPAQHQRALERLAQAQAPLRGLTRATSARWPDQARHARTMS